MTRHGKGRCLRPGPNAHYVPGGDLAPGLDLTNALGVLPPFMGSSRALASPNTVQTHGFHIFAAHVEYFFVNQDPQF